MDVLEQFISDNLLTREAILGVIDDYSILCFYIGEELEVRTKYSSPLRHGDSDPSFSIYYSKTNEDTLMYKDSALNKSGNVFMFLGEFLNMRPREVLLQINSDFGLGFEGDDVGDFKPHLIKKPPIKKAPTKILISSHDKNTSIFDAYWRAHGISQETLDRFFCVDVRVVHYESDYRQSIVTRELTIAYEILGHYKIYSPFAERKFKFRNNYPDYVVEGVMQLEFKSSFGMITKATKECMFFYEHFRWEAIAGKSETTPITEHVIELMRTRFSKVLIWLDKDDAGCTSQRAYIEKYPWLIPVEFDDSIEQKDPTDYYIAMTAIGKSDEALEVIKTTVNKFLNM